MEEADESQFWIGLAAETGYLPKELLHGLFQESCELTAILVAGLKTARQVQ
jgi:hypothetical protein